MRAELYVVGGSAMVLEYDSNRATRDVDCVITKGQHAVYQAVQTIAQEHGLPEDWLNEAAAVTHLIPEDPDRDARTSFTGSNLIVRTASPDRMIAMKIAASRAVDIDDLHELLPQSNIKDGKEAKELAEYHFPHLRIRDDTVEFVNKAIKERGMPRFRKGHVNQTPPKAPNSAQEAHNTQRRDRAGPGNPGER